MIRSVIDTNTLVSGLGWRGTPGALVDAALEGSLGLVTSQPLLTELARVLHYPKLARVFPEADRVVTLISSIAEHIEPTERLAVVTDEPDNRVLEAAIAAEVDVIVTGDKELHGLGSFRGIDLADAAEALKLVHR